MVSDLSHSPLYLSENEKAQLLGCKSYMNYEGITPVPVPTAPQEPRELDNCVWYQGWNEIWKCHYYHNVETGHSQWERPNEPFVPYMYDVDRQNQFLPHQHKRKRRPQGVVKGKSRGCARHPTKQERKERYIETLIEATGCNREEAKHALKATKKDLDLATSSIINSRKSKTSSTQELTKNTYPDQFYCSICLDVMNDAVCCSDGHSYCRTCICNWLKQSKSSPMTNESLVHTELIPNHALRSLISSTLLEEKQ